MQRWSEPSISRFTLAGMAGTAVLATMICELDPMLLGQIGQTARLETQFRDPHRVGWMVVLVFEGVVIFPMGFAFLSSSLPGNRMVKGLIWGTVVWFVAQGMQTPLVESTFLSREWGGLAARMISLADYLVYGAILGLSAGPATRGPKS